MMAFGGKDNFRCLDPILLGPFLVETPMIIPCHHWEHETSSKQLRSRQLTCVGIPSVCGLFGVSPCIPTRSTPTPRQRGESTHSEPRLGVVAPTRTLPSQQHQLRPPSGQCWSLPCGEVGVVEREGEGELLVERRGIYFWILFVFFLDFFFVFAGGFWLLVAFGFWLLFLCWLLVAFGF